MKSSEKLLNCKKRSNIILGVNLSHDASVCLLKDNRILSAISLERLNRVRHSGPFSVEGEFEINKAIDYVISSSGITQQDFDLIVIDTPESSDWMKEKLSRLYPDVEIIILPQPSHHLAHAYSTFYCSPFEESVVVVVDIMGSYLPNKYAREVETVYYFSRDSYEIIKKHVVQPGEIPASWIYNFLSNLLGFWVDPPKSTQEEPKSLMNLSKGGKTMALAAYGKDREDFPDYYEYYLNDKNIPHTLWYKFLLDQNLVLRPIPTPDLKSRFTQEIEWHVDVRRPWEPITQLHNDLAYFAQKNLEQRTLHLLEEAYQETKCKNLCLAGGIFLNSVMNNKILSNLPYNHIFIQPAATDDGCSIGCAVYGALKTKAINNKLVFRMPYTGRSYSNEEIINFLKGINSRFPNIVILNKKINTTKNIIQKTAQMIADGKIVACFRNGSEFGPRALGNRSILADPRDPKMKEKLNRIKKREWFRPFAPTVLKEYVNEWFEIDLDKAKYIEKYMICTWKVKKEKAEKIPSCLHVDNTARCQVLEKKDNEFFYNIIREFYKITGVPMVVNTSFNSKEPIVETPYDAFKTFINTPIGALILQDFLIIKKDDLTLKVI